jgi:nucleoid DNA-binding protein
MSKSEIATELAERGLGGKRQISNVLDALADLAMEETGAGEDFVIPGICKIGWSYRAPKAKGERWKKGDSVVGFGGIENVKDSDSPAQKAAVKLRPTLMGKVGKNRVGTKEQTGFLKSKAGKNVISRKAR